MKESKCQTLQHPRDPLTPSYTIDATFEKKIQFGCKHDSYSFFFFYFKGKSNNLRKLRLFILKFYLDGILNSVLS